MDRFYEALRFASFLGRATDRITIYRCATIMCFAPIRGETRDIEVFYVHDGKVEVRLDGVRVWPLGKSLIKRLPRTFRAEVSQVYEWLESVDTYKRFREFRQANPDVQEWELAHWVTRVKDDLLKQALYNEVVTGKQLVDLDIRIDFPGCSID